MKTFQELSCINFLCILDEEHFLIAVGSKINCWNIKKGKIYSLEFHSNKVQKIIKLKKNIIASCGFDGKIVIYDLDEQSIIFQFTTSNTFIRDFIIVNDYYVSCGDEGFINIDKFKKISQSNSVIQVGSPVNKIISDGRIIVAIGKKIHLFDFKTEKLIKEIDAHEGSVEDVIFYGDLFVTFSLLKNF